MTEMVFFSNVMNGMVYINCNHNRMTIKNIEYMLIDQEDYLLCMESSRNVVASISNCKIF